ncbi:MAG: MFS transporter [Actinomycetota bacterium]
MSGALGSSRSLRLVGSVLRNPDLRRSELAFAGFALAEYGTWVAILVYAYEHAGGSAGVGVAALVQLVPSAVVAPFASTMGDILGRRRALLLGYVILAASMGAVALALWLGASPVVSIGLAAVAATSITLIRPPQWAIQPSLAENPEEVTAANVVTTGIENAGILVGPALAGLLLAVAGPGLVFALAAGGLALSAAAIARIRDRGRPSEPHSLRYLLRASGEGLGLLVGNAESRAVVVSTASQSVVIGALDVLAVVLAFGLLHMGRGGAGYLVAAFGLGALVGAALSMTLVGRASMARPFAIGLAVFGTCFALIASNPVTLFALAMLAVAGVGRTFAEVAGRTLLQRVIPDEILSRAFGVLEGLTMAALALGAIAVPALIWVFGEKWTIVAVGCLLPAVIVVTRPRLRAADRAAPALGRRVQLLRAIDIFESLDPATMDLVASALAPVEVATGDTIVRQGERGHLFYVIDHGEVEVTVDGTSLAVLRGGDYFGEIALLRDVPRTATVTATNAARLYALERNHFLSALRGDPVAAGRADEVASRRHAEARSASGGAP